MLFITDFFCIFCTPEYRSPFQPFQKEYNYTTCIYINMIAYYCNQYTGIYTIVSYLYCSNGSIQLPEIPIITEHHNHRIIVNITGFIYK